MPENNNTRAFYSKRAKQLLRAARQGDPEALARLGAARPEDAGLMRAQHVVAVEAGFRRWADLPSAPGPGASPVGPASGQIDDQPAAPPSVRDEVEVAMRFLADRMEGALQRELPVSDPSEVAYELTYNGLAIRRGARLVLAWRGYWWLRRAELIDAARKIGDAILGHDGPTLTVEHSQVNALAGVHQPWAGFAWEFLSGSGAFTGCTFGENGTAALNERAAFNPRFWADTLAREPWDFETREERVARERAAAHTSVRGSARSEWTASPLPPGRLAIALRSALAQLPEWEEEPSATVARALANYWPDRFSIGGESAADWTFIYCGQDKRRSFENCLSELRRRRRMRTGEPASSR